MSVPVSPIITAADKFEEFCAHVRQAGSVACDTEFVSEYTYRPELCLLQLATTERACLVDPYAVQDLSSWWDIMVDDQTTIVLHGGREEIRFCQTYSGKSPRKIVDLQIAEGLRSRSFPLSYTSMVARVLKGKTHGKETRTDWRRRPLTQQQIEYGLEDVEYVLPIWERQRQSLLELGRLSWADAEFQRMVDELEEETSPESWRRFNGLHRLKPRSLAAARELIRWRESEAESRNQPVRKMLRDDLLLELAFRMPRSAKEILSTRDMNRPDYQKRIDRILQCIDDARNLPNSDLPEPFPEPDYDRDQDEQILSKVLAIALANRCAELNVSMTLVGTNADLRQLVRWHVYNRQAGPLPSLMQGWRTEVCGDLLTAVLDGKISFRVADPESEHPLKFERHA
ncbi:MAG: ribonuclease D [Planctomycetaceae bacterium]